MGVTKIRTEEPDADNLIKKYKETTKSVESLTLSWKAHQDREEISPPDGTVAIAVDIRKNKAAIRIYERQSEDFIDGIGTEEEGKVVVVPWNPSWLYFCTGSPRVGHIVKR